MRRRGSEHCCRVQKGLVLEIIEPRVRTREDIKGIWHTTIGKEESTMLGFVMHFI
jgi:hypothetical protein